MNPVTVIGLGLSPKDLTAEHLSLIEGADVLVGGKRHLAYFPDVRAEKKAITQNIPEVIEFIRDRMAGLLQYRQRLILAGVVFQS